MSAGQYVSLYPSGTFPSYHQVLVISQPHVPNVWLRASRCAASKASGHASHTCHQIHFQGMSMRPSVSHPISRPTAAAAGLTMQTCQTHVCPTLHTTCEASSHADVIPFQLSCYTCRRTHGASCAHCHTLCYHTLLSTVLCTWTLCYPSCRVCYMLASRIQLPTRCLQPPGNNGAAGCIGLGCSEQAACSHSVHSQHQLHGLL